MSNDRPVGIFRVIRPSDGADVTRDFHHVEELARNEDWAHGLVSCDMEGFYIGPRGGLVLADERGNFKHVPEGRLRIEVSGPAERGKAE